jgi:prevent-host-death family protein
VDRQALDSTIDAIGILAILMVRKSDLREKQGTMRYASVAEVKNRLSHYLAQARRTKQPIIVTHYGKPYALIHPLSERDLESLAWRQLGEARLREAWEGEDDALYDYL